jgi:hypothetical protein
MLGLLGGAFLSAAGTVAALTAAANLTHAAGGALARVDWRQTPSELAALRGTFFGGAGGVRQQLDRPLHGPLVTMLGGWTDVDRLASYLYAASEVQREAVAGAVRCDGSNAACGYMRSALHAGRLAAALGWDAARNAVTAAPQLAQRYGSPAARFALRQARLLATQIASLRSAAGRREVAQHLRDRGREALELGGDLLHWGRCVVGALGRSGGAALGECWGTWLGHYLVPADGQGKGKLVDERGGPANGHGEEEQEEAVVEEEEKGLGGLEPAAGEELAAGEDLHAAPAGACV